MLKKECKHCKKEFYKNPNTSLRRWAEVKFCSRRCHYDSKGFKKNCALCGKAFKVGKTRENTARFCGAKCYGEYRSKHQNEYIQPCPLKKENIKKCVICGKVFRAQGKKPRKCCSKKCMGRWQSENRRGKNHPNWKESFYPDIWSNIRSLPQYEQWRRDVLRRDNYTCQQCNKRSNLRAHHKDKTFKDLVKELLEKYDQFSPVEDRETLVRLAMTYEPFWNLDNGQTLCESCHRKTHSEMNYESKVY